MNINFEKSGGLLPVIIQHDRTRQVLMLGYMNEEAYNLTCSEGMVTFYSRSRKELWTKGTTSGNRLQVVRMLPDCDQDTLLILVIPAGPVCHTGTYSCFGENTARGFLYELEHTIAGRIKDKDPDSYTGRLFGEGLNRIIQKVGEEAVELVIESKDQDTGRMKSEAADLLYHLLILLYAKDISLEQVEATLLARSRKGK